MPRLAVLEEAKRKSSKVTREQREKAIKIIAGLLSRREEIVLALVFGGALIEGSPSAI